jgi:hypothetical protein
MQFERIRRVSVGDFLFQVGGKIDDVDGFKGTFFDADTAADAEFFGYKSYLGVGAYFYTKLSCCICFLSCFLSCFLYKIRVTSLV